MAKPTTVKIKLVSTADTGFFYVTKKNPRNITYNMTFGKYDPRVRKNVVFKDAKNKCGAAAHAATAHLNSVRDPALRRRGG